MRVIQKLVRNGSSTQVTIPRAMLMHLDWVPGNDVLVEVLEDGTLRVSKFEIVGRRGVVRTRTAEPQAASETR